MGHEVKPKMAETKKVESVKEPVKTYNKRKEVEVLSSQEVGAGEYAEVSTPCPQRYPSGTLFFGDEINTPAKRMHDSPRRGQREPKRESAEVSPRETINDVIKSYHSIWEEAAIGLIYEKYHTDVTVHQGTLEQHGVGDVVTGTMQMLHAFSNFRVIGEG